MAVLNQTNNRKRIKTEASFNKLYGQLNNEQKQAVDALEGPVMVLAGPGTGKTQVLTMRVANILRQTQMEPSNILCLTFTESAAVEMRQRLIKIIGEAAYYVRISTFHSFCEDVIQSHTDRFALSKQWQALSDVERVELWYELIEKLPATGALKPLGAPYLYVADIIKAVQLVKKEGVTPAKLNELLTETENFLKKVEADFVDFFTLKPKERTAKQCERLFTGLQKEMTSQANKNIWLVYQNVFDNWLKRDEQSSGEREASKGRTELKNEVKKMHERMVKQLPKQRELARLYQLYQEQLIARGRYDYEDMVLQVVSKLGRDDDLLAEYQEQYQYILVDEYQDTNGAQNELLKLLGSWDEKPNIFVVGDDKQSIFRFQGASLENLLSFYRQYRASIKIVALGSNYRSQQKVLDASAEVIANNEELISNYLPDISKKLIAVTEKPEQLLEQCVYETEAEEDYGVAQKIQSLLKTGVDPVEIAVLYRFNRDGEELLDIMQALDIPVRLEVGEDVLADIRVRQFLNLLGWVAGDNKKEEERLAEIFYYDWLSLPVLEVMQVIHFAGVKRRRLWEVIGQSELLEQAGVHQIKRWLALAKKMSEWRLISRNLTFHHWFGVVLEESGLLTAVLAGSDKIVELSKLAALFEEVKKLNRADNKLTARGLIRRFDLLMENDLPLTVERAQKQQQAVRLMTVHRAKGLEFEHVFLTKMVDRHWGNLRERTRLTVPQGLLEYDPVVGQQGNEDERRLFYVAMTRAKEKIYFSYGRQNKAGREQIPAIFWREVPTSLIEDTSLEETDGKRIERWRLKCRAEIRVVNQDDIKEWLKEQLETYVMSVTHLNNYLECPRLWYWRNMLRVPAAKTSSLIFGSVIHKVWHDYFARYNEKGVKPPLELLLDRLEYYVERELLTDQERKDLRQLGKKVLRQYFDHYQRQLAPKTWLEYDFRSHGVNVEGLVLTGKLDKIELPEEGRRVTVVDYKTGNPDNAVGRARPGGNYHRQLVFYKLLGDLSPRFKYDIVVGELDFIQPSKRSGQFVKKKFSISSSDVDELRQEIGRVWEEIKALRFLDEDLACGQCDSCQKMGV